MIFKGPMKIIFGAAEFNATSCEIRTKEEVINDPHDLNEALFSLAAEEAARRAKKPKTTLPYPTLG